MSVAMEQWTAMTSTGHTASRVRLTTITLAALAASVSLAACTGGSSSTHGAGATTMADGASNICAHIATSLTAQTASAQGATVTISKGGSTPSGVPSPPTTGRLATCTMTIAYHGASNTTWFAVYPKGTSLATYQRTLAKDGYKASVAASSTGAQQGLASPDAKHLVVFGFDGDHLGIEILTATAK